MTLYDRNGNPTPALFNGDEYKKNWDRIFRKKVLCYVCLKECKTEDTVEHQVSDVTVIYICKPCEVEADDGA